MSEVVAGRVFVICLATERKLWLLPVKEQSAEAKHDISCPLQTLYAPSCSFCFRHPTVSRVEIIKKLKVLVLFSLTYLGANLVFISGISTSYHHLLSIENFEGRNCPSLCVLGHVVPIRGQSTGNDLKRGLRKPRRHAVLYL